MGLGGDAGGVLPMFAKDLLAAGSGVMEEITNGRTSEADANELVVVAAKGN
jgi:hypothetical protein